MRILPRLSAVLLGLALPLSAGPMPDFSLKQLDGSTFKFSSVAGKQVVVIDFWATWCGPCTKMLKKLQELKDKYPDVLVLAISVDDAHSMAKVTQYVKGRGFTFTVLRDPDNSLSRLVNPTLALPFTMVVDKKGDVAWTHTGYVPGNEKDLFEKVEALRQ